jgi:hypothetical protein
MNNLNRKILYFGVCIPIRLIIPYIIYRYLNEKNFKNMSYLTGTIAIGFLYLYFSNRRLNAGEGGGKTWWHKLRLIHGLLYLTTTIYLIQKEKIAYLPLLLDILVGFWGYYYLRK